MSIGQHLKRLCESHGVARTAETFGQALSERRIDPYSVRLPDLTEAFLGRDYLSVERKARAAGLGQTHLLESSEAVDASAFSNITGQLLVTIIKEKYESSDFITDRIFKTIPNPGGNLKEHKVPYLSDVTADPKLLAALEPYPNTQFAESWIVLPAPEKRGLICAVSMEMLMSDLTGQAQDSAASVGRSLGYDREKRRLRVVLGITNNHVWNGNTLNTYVPTTPGTGNYVNKLLSTTITNYTQINSMEQLFWQMVDPITGRLINVRPTQMLVMPEKRLAIKRILGAVETRDGNITSGTGVQTLAANPLEIGYDVLTSAIARSLLINEAGLSASNAAERVYFFDGKKAFGYRELYPLKIDQAPANNPMEFNQDIVMQVKCSEFGIAFTYDPRYTGLSVAEAS